MIHFHHWYMRISYCQKTRKILFGNHVQYYDNELMHARKNLPPHRWHYHIICIHECLLRHYEKRSMVIGVPIVSIEETFTMLLILLVLQNTRTSHTRKRWENSFGFTWHNMTMWQTRRTLFMLQITDLHNIKAYQCSYANGDNSLHNNTKADRNTGQEWAIITAYSTTGSFKFVKITS
jgi:hypothetical protein